MKLRTIGIDLAKNVFQACGVNEHMKSQFNKRLKRHELLDFMRQQEPTMVVMEACYSSHKIKGVRVILNGIKHKNKRGQSHFK